MIRADRDAGLRPFLLVATAGNTGTGTVDQLPQLAAAAVSSLPAGTPTLSAESGKDVPTSRA